MCVGVQRRIRESEASARSRRVRGERGQRSEHARAGGARLAFEARACAIADRAHVYYGWHYGLASVSSSRPISAALSLVEDDNTGKARGGAFLSCHSGFCACSRRSRQREESQKRKTHRVSRYRLELQVSVSKRATEKKGGEESVLGGIVPFAFASDKAFLNTAAIPRGTASAIAR